MKRFEDLCDSHPILSAVVLAVSVLGWLVIACAVGGR